MAMDSSSLDIGDHLASDRDDQEGGFRVGDIYIPPPPLPACTFDTTGPRLLISHIENEQFKSYAKQTGLGPFHKNFTAIVGPNGSGKSNVIDAMLFVFGYRAQKIRSKKIGVLIHNSDKFPNLQTCTVKVHFQMIIDKGSDEFDIVPNSNFYISRTAYRDNSSTYSIDGKRVLFKEVSKLLRSYGIDLDHNRFLILQGEIELIAMMKPKGTETTSGMLEYLEDIIGCNRLVEPIKQLEERYQQHNEERLDKLNRMKLAEKDKEDVETAKNEAMDFLKMENQVTHLENKVLQVKIFDGMAELETATEDCEEVKKKLNTLTQAHDELKQVRSVKDRESDDIRKQHSKCAQTCERCKERYEAMERQDVVIRENFNTCKAKIKKSIKLLESEEEKLGDLKKQPLTHEGEAQELMKKKGILEQKKEGEQKKLNEVMASMKGETASLQEEKEKHESKLIGLKKVVNEAKSEMDIAQSQLDLYLSSERNEQTRLSDLEQQHEKNASAINEKERLHQEAESKIPELQTKISNSMKLHKQMEEKETKISEEVRVKRSKVGDMKNSFHSNKSRSTLLNALMEQKNNGTIPGIFGRLGDLGAIEEKYDVAISTACGALENIVTDTIDTAQKCVEYLKRTNKGYATFIALDKMRKWMPYMSQPFKAPENVPRLFDLVKVKDDRVLPAFYFALKDTLVANDLDQATRVGLHSSKRYRCVTLKGELIDIVGTMSGGGTRVMSGRMGQSVAQSDINPKEIEKLVASLDSSVKILDDLRQEKVNLQNVIAQSQKELSALQLALKKNAMESKTLKESQAPLKKQIDQQTKKVAACVTDKNKVTQLTSVLDKTKKGYEIANSAASTVDEKVKGIHAEIMAITKGKFSTVQKSVNKLTKEIDTVQTNITKSKASVKTAARNMKKSEEKINSLQEEIAQAKQERENIMKEIKDIEEKAAAVLAERDEANKEMAVWEEKKKALQKDMNTFKETELKMKSDLIELKNQLRTKEGTLKEKSDYVKRKKHALANLKLQSADEEDEDLTLPTLTEQELESLSVNQLQYEEGALQAQMTKMKPNMNAIAEYKKKEEMFKKKLAELEEITQKRDEMKKHYDELRKLRLEEFMNGFKIITSKLKEVYQMITLGGDAELELVDSLDPFSEGIVFSVRPPKKSWKNITNLSGGEKTLSSLALVFALHYYKPTPFYVMDEIDAALDYKNVSIVGNYIKERTKNAQFIIISLRNNMFELADRLVGIYKTSNVTQTVTISPSALVGVEGENEEEHNNENVTEDVSPMMFSASTSTPQSSIATNGDHS